MTKLLLILLAFALISKVAFAQQTLVPCIQTTTPNGGTSCVPVSTSAPVPVGLQ